MPVKSEIVAVSGQEQINDSHEVRIQRVEEEVSDIKSTLSSVETKLDAFSDKMDQALEALSFKLDAMIAPIAKDLHEHVEEDKVLHGTLSQSVKSIDFLEDRIKPFEEAKVKSDARRASIKKALWGVIIAVVGVLAKEFVVLVNTWIK